MGCGGALVRPLSPQEVEAERTSSRPPGLQDGEALKPCGPSGFSDLQERRDSPHPQSPSSSLCQKTVSHQPSAQDVSLAGATSGIALSASSLGQNILHHRELLKIQCFFCQRTTYFLQALIFTQSPFTGSNRPKLPSSFGDTCLKTLNPCLGMVAPDLLQGLGWRQLMRLVLPRVRKSGVRDRGYWRTAESHASYKTAL